MLRATNMGAAFVNAAVKADQKKSWVARAVVDRALHTTTGNVSERDRLNVSHRTAVHCGLTK